jgi:transposase
MKVGKIHTEIEYIGIDVSKETLDIDAGSLGAAKIANTPAQVRKTLAQFTRKATLPLQVCFESTGPYIRPLVAVCQAKSMPYSVLNSQRVSSFAKALASAKTDAIDAYLIRLYAQVRRPAPTPILRKALVELDKLVLARDAIVKCNVALTGTLETLTGSPAKLMRRVIAANKKKIDECGRLIAKTVKSDEETAGLVSALTGVIGVGELTAVKVISGMPELGHLGRRRVSSLAGLAPHTRESGHFKGKARTGGGRKSVRDALFMAATVAIRFDPEMKRFHEGLMARGKPYMVALTAVMRKMLCHLESVAKAYYAQRPKEDVVVQQGAEEVASPVTSETPPSVGGISRVARRKNGHPPARRTDAQGGAPVLTAGASASPPPPPSSVTKSIT